MRPARPRRLLVARGLGRGDLRRRLRYLGEDPWERLRRLKQALLNTPVQMLLRGQNLLGYRHYSDDVVEAFVCKSAENGVEVFRIFDAMNDIHNLRTSIEAVLKAGKHAQGAICYTLSPVHTPDHFVEMARALADMGCHSIAIKDMAGLLTPVRAAELYAALSRAVKRPLAPTEFNVTLHGETYHIRVTGAGHKTDDHRPFYVTVDGVPEEILVETLAGTVPAASAAAAGRAARGSRRPKASAEGHVTSSMPGTVVEVLVKTGDPVSAGDPVLVIEAMKMENEVPAPVAGTVKAINVAKGDRVNPDEALVEIE